MASTPSIAKVFLFAILTVPLAACDKKEDDENQGDENQDDADSSDTQTPDMGGGETLQWYATCGDPVCRGYTGPFPNVPLCSGEAVGALCGTAGARCDPKDGCNAQLLCSDRDPRQQAGGCPISRGRFKDDVRYLSDAQRQELH